MIVRRLLFFLMGATALSVSAGVVVVALAFALFALVQPAVGSAGAAAVVAGAAAILIGVIGLLLARLARPPRRKPSEAHGAVDSVIDFVRSRPVTTLAGAIAAGVLAVRNPAYLGSLMRAFMEGREPRRRDR